MQSLFKMATIDCWMIWQKIEKIHHTTFPHGGIVGTPYYITRENKHWRKLMCQEWAWIKKTLNSFFCSCSFHKQLLPLRLNSLR